MFVAASTNCFHDLPFEDCIEKIVDLEFSAIEISIEEHGNHLKPSNVVESLNDAVAYCKSTRRLNVIGYNLEIDAEGDEYLKIFDECCKLSRCGTV